MTLFLKKHWITLSICIIITILCFINVSSLPPVEISNFDKFVHLLMFGGVSGSIFFENSYYFKTPVSIRRLFFGSLLFPILLSGAIEVAQEYLSVTRTGDWIDFLFDGIGAFLGMAISLIINRALPAKNI